MMKNEEQENCEHENSFFNGVCYECPECDYEWGEIETDDEFDTEEEE
jgi:uncharacterized Zn ribbon protein